MLDFDLRLQRWAEGLDRSARVVRPFPAPRRRPRVSIVVPCYRYGHFLDACVQSILEQEGVDVDVLIIDDASPDDSFDVARRIAAAEPRVTAIRNAVNLGHIATYNKGLSRATGDYVVLLSADDMLTRGCLARATDVMEADSGVGLVYGNPLVITDDHIPPARTRARSTSIWRGVDWISAQARRGLSCIYCPEVVVRTRVQMRVGGYSHALPHTADLEMWLRIAAVADIARVNGSDQAYRRMHPASMMQTSYGSVLADLVGRRDAYETFFARGGAALPRAAQDLQMSRRALAIEALDCACTSLREGTAEASEVEACAAFAEKVYGPATRLLPQWGERELLTASARGRGDAVRLRYRAMARHLSGRYRGYRWRWAGV